MGFKLKKPDDAVGSAAPAILIGCFVAFGGVLFGYDTGTISGILAMKYWRRLFSTGYINPADGLPDVTSAQSSEIVSLLSAGTFFGALTAAPVADFFGRRISMILECFVFCFGVALQTAATAIPLFVAGRFFAGFGVGLLSATIPLYQSETSPKWIRGAIVGCYQLAITVGLLLAAIVNNATKDRNDTGCYRIPIAVQFAWAIILIVGMLILPETPRFLIKRGKHEAAAKSLARLRRIDVDNPALTAELAEIQANHEYELSLGQASYIEILRGTLGKRLATGCGVQALQQLAGVNFIFYYGTSFFQNSGIQNSFVITLITSIINVASTFPGLYMVEKWGRRPLLLFGAVGMCVSQLIVAIVGTAASSVVANKVLIAFVCLYIFFFASSWGPVAWVVTGELFPLKARARCLSITTATNWLLNWAIAYATPYMVNSGPGNANLQSKVFFIWGGFCFICMIFVYCCIYETKGLTLEQVDELYAKVPVAWQSPGFVPSVNFCDVRDVADGSKGGMSLADLEAGAQEKRTADHVERAES
ncbi:MFS monosaccharide transporter [Rasamsonia emersonii CBS 393.64]|uniref:MFS monosaccharide transporter n=1 Tax=Rasamsonia emersonii (strain ATCC 16479 / CBS 393.64 / IMI 116815) TaxID=1408163 RepID=A0A0F4YDZ9_RASE3|nr:MFS monosaccharide transporter [Rasamsonia emersonii CBS 393.64]KKA16360.1 MFS monosaccharide transporter [Rasamsonia emersonii CBS 393.64]